MTQIGQNHRMKFRLGLAVVGLAALVMAGCQEPRTVGGVPRPNPGAPIVSLAPSASDLLGMMLQGQRVVGVTDACPPTISAGKSVVVRNTKVDFEKIAELRPGIILYDSTITSPADVAKLQQGGGEVFDVHVKTFRDMEENLYRMASLVGNESSVSEFIDKMYIAKERFPQSEPPVKVMILMGGTGEYMAAGTKSLQADLVKNVSGTPVGPDSDKFETINAEAIIQANPNIIFTSQIGQRVLADPRLQSLDAVKGKRVFDVHPDHLLRVNSQLDLVLDAMGTGINNYRINKSKE